MMFAPLLAPSLLLFGCHPAAGDFEVAATIEPDVATVVVVEWETDEPGASWVEFGVDGVLDRSTAIAEPSLTSHRFLLLGLPALTTVSYRAVTQTASGTLTAEGEVDTSGLPSDLPGFTVATDVPDLRSSESWFAASILGTRAYVVILDRQGNIVWYWEVEPLDLAAPTLGEVDVSEGGSDLWVLVGCWQSEPSDCTLQRVSLEGDLVAAVPAPNAHHVFEQTHQGSVAYLATDVRPWYDEEEDRTLDVWGDAIVEVRYAGEQRVVFSTWDWFPVTKEEGWDRSPYASEGDWTHGNGLHYDPQTNHYLLSMANLDAVAEVDRGSGELLTMFGAAGIAPDASSTPFSFQHGALWTEDRHLLLTTRDSNDQYLLAVEYEVREDRTLHEVWSVGQEEGLDSMAGGHVLRLDNGNTLLNAGTAGVVLEYSPEREVVWSLQCDLGSAFTSVRPIDDLYGADAEVAPTE